MPEILLAAALAPVVVLPLCSVAAVAAKLAVRCHRAFTWPWRIGIGLLAVKFVVDAFLAVEVLARVIG